MAIVKTLIVKGVARFLTDAYMSTIRSGIWNGSTIQVGYGGTGVTSAKGNLYTPVFLASNGITPCSVEIPHATKAFKINGVTFDVFTNSTGAAPTIFAPTTLAGTGGYILATNSAKNGLEWVAANGHTHSLYVLLDSGTAEQTIKSSISSLSNGVIELWRAVASGYPMIGFANGTTKTHLGKLGFGSEANKPIFRNTSNTDYLLAHAGNIVNDNITVALNTEKTIATIAGVTIKLKVTGTNNVTTSAVVASSASGTTLITAALANPFYNLLEGGVVTRSIQFTSSNIAISSTTGGVISFTAASWAGATSEAAGTAGYMPGAASADRTKFLRGDGSWIALSLTDHTHSVKINGSTKTIAAPGGTAVNLGDYTEGKYGYSIPAGTTKIISLVSPGCFIIGTKSNGGDYFAYLVLGYGETTVRSLVRVLYQGSNTECGIVNGSHGSKIWLKNKNTGSDGSFYVIGGTPEVTDWNSNSIPASDLTLSNTVAYSLNGHTHSWASITSKPTAIGSETQPVYWDGSTFVLANSYGSTVDNKNATIKVTSTTVATVAGVDITAKINTANFLEAYELASGTDINTVVDNKYYVLSLTLACAAMVNGPTGRTDGEMYLLNIRCGGNFGQQLYYSRANTTWLWWTRTFKNSSFSDWVLIVHSGNVSNKSATIGTSLTTIATIAGVSIKAKIPDVTAQATQLAKVTKTLAVSTWTDMAAISTYSGTYAIQISSGNVMASGVFTACGGTDSVIDEIPLHVADKGTNTWRPYARISAGQLQMTTNEATGTSREYTIKILKLI